MSKKKKIPVEDLRSMLEDILLPFVPVDLRIKSGKIILSENILEAIDESRKRSQEAEKEKIALPDSTVNLARYGGTINDILANFESYIVTKKVKKMSQRKGIMI